MGKITIRDRVADARGNRSFWAAIVENESGAVADALIFSTKGV